MKEVIAHFSLFKIQKAIFFLLALTFGLKITAQGVWTQKANVDTVHRSIGTGFSVGNYGYIGLGQNDGQNLSDFWKWNSTTDLWVEISPFLGGQRRAPISFVIGSKAYVGLGGSASGYFNDLYSLDTATGQWMQEASMPAAAGLRAAAACFAIGTNAYVVAGTPGGKPYYDDVWEYNSLNNSWTQKNNLPSGIGNVETLNGFTLGSFGYIEGGWNGSVILQNIWQYNPIKDTWTIVGTTPGTARGGEAIVIIKGIPLFGGGIDMSGNNLTDFWQMDTSNYTWSSVANFPATGRFCPAFFSIGNSGYIGTGSKYYHSDEASPDGLKDFWRFSTLYASFYATSSVICKGDTVQLKDQSLGNPTSWKWSFGGGIPDTSSLQNPKIAYADSGHYSVKLVISGLNGSDSITLNNYITVVSPLSSVVTTSSNSNTICQGTGYVQSNSSGKNQWYFNGSTIKNDTSQKIFPDQSGFYAVMETDTIGCSAISIPTSVTVLPAPIPQIGTKTGTTICSGSIDTLFAFGSGKYLWSTADTASSIIVSPSISTTYTLTVTGANGCASSISQLIKVNSSPAVPVIQQNGSLLASTASQGNQWYLNGNPINGATSQYFTPIQSGFYQVILNGIDGCSSASNIINYTYTGIDDFNTQNQSLTIYPNPATGTFKVETNSTEKQLLQIFDITGKLMLFQNLLSGKSTIEGSSLSQGVYNVSITSNEGVSNKRLVIIK